MIYCGHAFRRSVNMQADSSLHGTAWRIGRRFLLSEFKNIDPKLLPRFHTVSVTQTQAFQTVAAFSDDLAVDESTRFFTVFDIVIADVKIPKAPIDIVIILANIGILDEVLMELRNIYLTDALSAHPAQTDAVVAAVFRGDEVTPRVIEQFNVVAQRQRVEVGVPYANAREKVIVEPWVGAVR